MKWDGVGWAGLGFAIKKGDETRGDVAVKMATYLCSDKKNKDE